MKYETTHHLPWVEVAATSVDFRTGEWRFLKPVRNKSKCCRCGQCALFCPPGCIYQKGASFETDWQFCKGCGICASVCPINSIAMVRAEV